MSPCIIPGFTLKTFSTYSNYLQTSDAIFSFFAPSDFNDDDFISVIIYNFWKTAGTSKEINDRK